MEWRECGGGESGEARMERVNGQECEATLFLTKMVIPNKSIDALLYILRSFLISPTIPYDESIRYIVPLKMTLLWSTKDLRNILVDLFVFLCFKSNFTIDGREKSNIFILEIYPTLFLFVCALNKTCRSLRVLRRFVISEKKDFIFYTLNSLTHISSTFQENINCRVNLIIGNFMNILEMRWLIVKLKMKPKNKTKKIECRHFFFFISFVSVYITCIFWQWKKEIVLKKENLIIHSQSISIILQCN